jgi:hypothetical protein
VRLDDLVLPGTSPVDQLYGEFYGRMRTGMSHAKTGRAIILPREDAERTEVTESLSRLVVVYERLAESMLGVWRAGGLQLSAATAHAMGEASLANVAAYACDRDVLDGQSDVNVHESPATAVMLSGSDLAQPVGRSRVTRLFWAPATELASLSVVRAVCSADSDGAIFMSAVLAAGLHLGSAARFEVVLGSRSTNIRRSRDHYST